MCRTHAGKLLDAESVTGIDAGHPTPGVGEPDPATLTRISHLERIPANPQVSLFSEKPCRCLSGSPRLDSRLLNPERLLRDYQPGKKPDSKAWAIAREIFLPVVLALCFLAGFLGYLSLSGCRPGFGPAERTAGGANRPGGDVVRG